MGGGDKPKEDAMEQEEKEEGEEGASATVGLEVLCEYMKIPAHSTEVTIMAKLKALPKPDEDRRAPITICAAIDRSGSMKEHLPLLKETLQFMVQQLRSEDKLSLITFDHEVRVELPLTNMDSAGKLHAERAIEGVKERGHTNLSGGLLAALEALYRTPSADASLVESVLLFTDGKANVGIRDQTALVKATRSVLGQIGRQACVFTFGYGSEYDSELLHAVADAGNGLFYYIDNSDSIPESFCDCLGGLLSVAAQNVRLTFQGLEGVLLHKPQTTFRTTAKEGGVYEVAIPDVYCEEEKCILAKVMVKNDPTIAEARSVPLVQCIVDYFDVLRVRPTQCVEQCSVVRNKMLTNPIQSDSFDEIELHKVRCEVADALGKANGLAGSGNIAGARDVLSRATVRLKGSVVFARPLAVHLLETLQESLGGLESSVTYREHGRAVMTNYAGSHWQQRSNTKPSAMGYSKHKRAAEKTWGSKPLSVEDVQQEMYSPYRNAVKYDLMSKHSHSSHSKK